MDKKGRDRTEAGRRDAEDEQKVALFLDALNQQNGPAPSHLHERIAAQVTQASVQPDAIDRLLAWLVMAPWRPALAAVIPLIFGFLIGFSDTLEYESDIDTLIYAEGFRTYQSQFGFSDLETNDDEI